MTGTIIATLERHGVIWLDPPGFGGWGMTPYGRHLLRFLIDAG
ncbi:MAG TPA: hypothetical protein VHE80_05290 [Acidimicrobiales bacterium]|nr:hypothetical protein [Acidimicrobiales bacterium]